MEPTFLRGAVAAALIVAQVGCRRFESSTAIKSFEQGGAETISLWGQNDLMHTSKHYCRVELRRPWHFTSELILSTRDPDMNPPGSHPHSDQYAGCLDRLLKVGQDLQGVSRLQIVREPRWGGRVRVDLFKGPAGQWECSATAAKPGQESAAETFVDGVKGGRGNYQGCADLIAVQEDLLVGGNAAGAMVGARGVAYLKWPETGAWTTCRLAGDPSAASLLQWVSSVEPSSAAAITGYRATAANLQPWQKDVTFEATVYFKWPWRLYATLLPQGGCRFDRPKTLSSNEAFPAAAPKSGHSMEFQYLEYAPGVRDPPAPGAPGILKRIASGRLNLGGSEWTELPALERAPRLEVRLAAEYPDPLGPPWFMAQLRTLPEQYVSSFFWRLDRWERRWVSPASGEAPIRAVWVKIAKAAKAK